MIAKDKAKRKSSISAARMRMDGGEGEVEK
jgi:hypothetical protein